MTTALAYVRYEPTFLMHNELMVQLLLYTAGLVISSTTVFVLRQVECI